MEKFTLEIDNRIPSLEKEERWDAVADILYSNWQKNPDNLNCLLCAGVGIWYVIVLTDTPYYWDKFNREFFTNQRERLLEVTHHGIAHFDQSPLFNAYFGYLIKVMPYFFFDSNGGYDKWQSKGKQMMLRSYELAPDNPFTKAIAYEADAPSEKVYLDACKELWKVVTPEQWGSSEIQQYFFRILNGERFYPNTYPDEDA